MVTGIRIKPVPRRITVEMPYPGSVISVNHYRGRTRQGGEFVRADAQAWMDMLGWQLKMAHLEDWKLPLSVRCDGVFKDFRSAPDLSNLSKVTLDAIQEVSGVNDKDMRWHDGERIIDNAKEPTITITINEAE